MSYCTYIFVTLKFLKNYVKFAGINAGQVTNAFYLELRCAPLMLIINVVSKDWDFSKYNILYII